MELTWILKTLLEQSTIIYSGVIITDADLSLMNAIGVVFPKPTTSFDLAHSKQYQSPPPQRFFFNRGRGGNPLDISCIFKMWSLSVLDIKHQDQFEEAWIDMKRHVTRVCHEYIEHSWFIPYKDKFCAAWLVEVQHFGQIFSSKVQSEHAAFKKTLGASKMFFSPFILA